MRGQQQPDAPEKRPPEKEMSMKEMWAEAAKSFESICGESLQRGEVRSFEDVRAKIESRSKPGVDDEPGDRWEKAKSVGLESLKYLKLLVGAACQASEFVGLDCSLFLTAYTLTPVDPFARIGGKHHEQCLILRVRHSGSHQGLQ